MIAKDISENDGCEGTYAPSSSNFSEFSWEYANSINFYASLIGFHQFYVILIPYILEEAGFHWA